MGENPPIYPRPSAVTVPSTDTVKLLEVIFTTPNVTVPETMILSSTSIKDDLFVFSPSNSNENVESGPPSSLLAIKCFSTILAPIAQAVIGTAVPNV